MAGGRDLRSITEQHGNVDWSGTVYPGHAIQLARQAAKKTMTWSLHGGDGTVHEVMNASCKSLNTNVRYWSVPSVLETILHTH